MKNWLPFFLSASLLAFAVVYQDEIFPEKKETITVYKERKVIEKVPERSLASVTDKKSTIEDEPLKLLYPINSEVLKLADDTPIYFVWNKIKGNIHYNLQLKIDDKITKNFTATSNVLNVWDLQGSKIVYKLTAFDGNKEVSVDAGRFYLEVPKSTVVKKAEEFSKMMILAPRADEEIVYKNAPIPLIWNGDLSSEYIVEVKNKSTKKELKTMNIVGPRAELNISNVGDYKVTVFERKNPDLKIEVDFTLKKKIAEFDSKNVMIIDGKKVSLNLKNYEPGLNAFVKVSDQEHDAIVDRVNLESLKPVVSVNHTGTYCFQVLQKVPSKYYIDSDSYCFKYNPEKAKPVERKIASVEAVEEPPFEFRDIPRVQQLVFSKLNGEIGFQLAVPKQDNVEAYNLNIFRKGKKDELVGNFETKSNKIVWLTNNETEAFYKFRVKFKDGQYSDFSRPIKLVFPISPFND